jgi:hypothetical protein
MFKSKIVYFYILESFARISLHKTFLVQGREEAYIKYILITRHLTLTEDHKGCYTKCALHSVTIRHLKTVQKLPYMEVA